MKLPRGEAMAELLRQWFLPEQVRFLPGARAWSITFRTVHLAAFGLLLGGHAFAADPEQLLPYLWLTILSGIGLIALEVYTHGLYWLFLGKGIMVLVKLCLLLAVPFFWEQRVALLLLVVGIASVGSHMPARFRHYSFLHGRVIEAGEPLRHGLSPMGAEAATVTALDDGGAK
ncbi:MAG: hypothetical protein ACE5JQ_11125 [Candidatus Methylomirabilales bacterium]